MKRLMSVCAAAVCAAVAFALPKVEVFPADVDVTMVFLCKQQTDPAVVDAWKAAFVESNPWLFGEFLEEWLLPFVEKSPALRAMVKAVAGPSEDGKQMALRSVSLGLLLPQTPEALDKTEEFNLLFAFENPDFKAEEFTAAMQAHVATDSEASLTPVGEWMAFQHQRDGADVLYKPYEQGLLLAITFSVDAATAWLAGEKLTADAPVAAPFAAAKKPLDCVFALRDMSKVLTLMEPDENERKAAELEMPWAFKLHRVMFSSTLNGLDAAWTLSATMESADASAQLKKTAEHYRKMAAQTLLPANLQLAKSTLATWLRDSVVVESEGPEMRVRMKVPPKAATEVLKVFFNL